MPKDKHETVSGQKPVDLKQDDLSPTGQDLLSKIAGTQAKEQEPTEGAGDGNEPQDNFLEIDEEGVTRKVKVEDLTSAWRDREKLRQMEQVLNDRAQKDAGMRAMSELIEGMTQGQKARLQQFLANPDLLEQEQQEQGGSDDILGDLLGEEEADSGHRKAFASLAQKLSQQEQVLQSMAAYLNQELQTRKTNSQRQQVEEVMSQFKVLQGQDDGIKAGREMILESVMDKLAANPDAKVDDLVRSHAKRLQELLDHAREGSVEQMGFERPPVLKLPKGRSPKAGDLLTGGALKLARDILGGA